MLYFRQGLIITILLISGVSVGYTQLASEMLIPIGKSPGLSHIHTTIETITVIDILAHTVTTNNRTITISDSTRIWLDHSKQAMRNTIGSFKDLVPGRTIEVLLLNVDDKTVTNWVKVEVPPE